MGRERMRRPKRPTVSETKTERRPHRGQQEQEGKVRTRHEARLRPQAQGWTNKKTEAGESRLEKTGRMP